MSVLAVVLSLMLLGDGVLAAEAQQSATSQILVTFSNEGARRSGFATVGGRPYRKRLRYAIAAQARRYANAVASDFHLSMVDDWPIKALNVYCVVYQLTQDGAADAILIALAADSRVESVQAMKTFRTLTTESTAYNDAYAGLQYSLVSMDVESAHRLVDGKGVNIAVIDTGVDNAHEDLAHALSHSRSFVDRRKRGSNRQHGTAVASVISAAANNGRGIVGVAPGADLWILEACWSERTAAPALCNSFTLAKALDHILDTGPDLVNMSLAGPDDPLVGRLLRSAIERGIIIVAARANGGSKDSVFPADMPGVLSVAADIPAEARQRYRADQAIQLVAPGEHIMVALPNDEYDFRSGNSLAAAHVSGAIALLLQHAPTSTAEQILVALQRSQDIHHLGGVVNACRALLEIDADMHCK